MAKQQSTVQAGCIEMSSEDSPSKPLSDLIPNIEELMLDSVESGVHNSSSNSDVDFWLKILQEVSMSKDNCSSTAYNNTEKSNYGLYSLYGMDNSPPPVSGFTASEYTPPPVDVWPTDSDIARSEESSHTEVAFGGEKIVYEMLTIDAEVMTKKLNLRRLNPKEINVDIETKSILSNLTKTIKADAVKFADSFLNAAAAHASSMAAYGDLAMSRVHETVESIPVAVDIRDCAVESFLLTMDRARYLSDTYVAPLVMHDDPETQHLRALSDPRSVEWCARRVCMASVPWQQRQLLQETRDTADNKNDDSNNDNDNDNKSDNSDDIYSYRLEEGKTVYVSHEMEPSLKLWLSAAASRGCTEAQYALSRWFTPPSFQEARACGVCTKYFTGSLFRHHCRHCGRSVCSAHSPGRRRILRLGMTAPVRVCLLCERLLDEEARHDGLQWRQLRARAFLSGQLLPYFQPRLDRNVDKALRLVEGSLNVVKNTLILNYPAKIILETVDILKRYGLSGLTGVLMRKDFMEAVETLKRVSGMEKMFSLSLHELTACIYYKLAIDRGLRGVTPELEHAQHTECSSDERLHCCGVSPELLEEAIRLAPLALTAVYESDPVECQRIAALQRWETIYTYNESAPEQPAYALFASSSGVTKEMVLAVRGTNSVQDLVTDVRATPSSFPPSDEEVFRTVHGLPAREGGEESVCAEAEGHADRTWEWLQVSSDRRYACGGMARAAMWLLSQVGPSLLLLGSQGYALKVVGHSLGGAVAALLTFLLMDYAPGATCVTYGCPSCVDASIADSLRGRVVNIVLHDDVISRITPQSIRGLMKEILVFRSQVFRHLEQDWADVIARASSLWTPRWRGEPAGGGATCGDEAPSPIGSSDDAVMVDEEQIAQLWLPGRVVHLYSHRGCYRAAEVPRSFPSLRRIEVQGHMFSDHWGDNVFEALLQARAVSRARAQAPLWVPFDSSSSCQACGSSFTWHSTFQGEAQEYRERYNCRSCGALVCGPCSQQRRAIPRIGLISPVRICDSCFYRGDFADE